MGGMVNVQDQLLTFLWSLINIVHYTIFPVSLGPPKYEGSTSFHPAMALP